VDQLGQVFDSMARQVHTPPRHDNSVRKYSPPLSVQQRIEVQQRQQRVSTWGDGLGEEEDVSAAGVSELVVIQAACCVSMWRVGRMGRVGREALRKNFHGSDGKDAVSCLLLLIFGTFAFPYLNICRIWCIFRLSTSCVAIINLEDLLGARKQRT
jgi:hypothetical protein